MPDLTPEDVAGREFRSSFRGYEPTEVRSFLSEVGAGLRALLDEVDRLRSHVAAATPADVKAEIEAVSAEVHGVLRAAQEAAESMRERASSDATRWRSEAVAEAEVVRKDAAVDAEALRSDAWTMSDQLLSQCKVESERIVEDARKEALRIVGEAEREAHRLQAGARRESEDLVRSARMEAEQLQAEAKSRHDELIQEALKQSESAQERTLALEKRRQELLGELESVRATLVQVEDALDQRRERLGLSPSSEAVGKIVTKDHTESPPDGEEEDENWVPGETVRVVRPSKPGEEAGAAEITTHPPQPEVKVLSGSEFARLKAGLEPTEGLNEIPEVEDEGLLDQREEESSSSVKLVGSSESKESSSRPEPEMLEPEDFSGPVEAVAVEEDEVPAVAEPPVMESTDGDDTSEPEPDLDEEIPDDTVALAEEAPRDEADSFDAESVEPSPGDADSVASLAEDIAEPSPAMSPSEEPDVDSVVDSTSVAEPQPEVASAPPPPVPGPESTRYTFGDHVVVRTSVTPTEDAEPGGSDSQPVDDTQPDDEADQDQQSLFGEVAGLFDRLRVDGPTPSAAGRDEAAGDDVEAMMSRRLVSSMLDPFELRDRLLLPVGNRALRNLKRQLTEAQNVALEEIRLDESGWMPDAETLRERVRADLVVLFAESFGAGHAAAEEVLGGRVPRPATPQTDVADRFVTDLAAELEQVVSEGRGAGQGARQLGATLSRVFRGWRTDQAERRVRDLSLTGYHQGLTRSFELGGGPELTWKVAGRGCATCRAAGEETPSDMLPPAHPGCECTLGP
jgi:DivIVA domain-containing protein